MESPVISLIIPTYNRASSLESALEAIAASSLNFNDLEVIVVDDGSEDETGIIAGQPQPFPVKYRYQANLGDARARNSGVRASSGAVLIFLDDDVIVSPTLLHRMATTLQVNENTIVAGQLVNLAPENARLEEKSMSGPPAPSQTPIEFMDCRSGLLAVHRSDFFRIGMWQPLPLPGSSIWSDVDFAYRAHLKGYSFIKVTDAVGYHLDVHRKNLRSRASRLYRAGYAGVLLFQRHPALRSHLPMFRDKFPVHLRRDSMGLIVRKVLRRLASSAGVIAFFYTLHDLVEAHARLERGTVLLRRWILGANIYRGFRAGIREFGQVPDDL